MDGCTYRVKIGVAQGTLMKPNVSFHGCPLSQVRKTEVI